MREKGGLMELSAKDLAWMERFRSLIGQEVSFDLPIGLTGYERFDDYTILKVGTDGMVHARFASDTTGIEFHVASIHFIYPPAMED
jgi:hypothetical protein